MSAPRTFTALREALASERSALVDHPIYARISTLDDVRVFMEHHVFAVWDFMSLLKSLQRQFTCIDVPWVPRGDPVARRLVNEIVVAEESDDAVNGGYASHFELYLDAMKQCGADTSRVDDFVRRSATGVSVDDALTRADVPRAAQRFVKRTFATIESGSTARIASAFTIGREDVIPDMFRRLVADVHVRSGGRLELFLDYLNRHIHLDGERHGPMAARLLESMCGTDEARWEEALAGGRDALTARRAFWDAIERARSAGIAEPTAFRRA